IVLAHAGAMRQRLFPGSRILATSYGGHDGRVANNDVTLTVDGMHAGKPARARIHVWLSVHSGERVAVSGGPRSGRLHTQVRSGTVDAFDGHRLREGAQYKLWLERAGWDARLDDCRRQAARIRSMNHADASEDAQEAEWACER